MEHTPLDPASLSSDAQRALAPGPGKMMAARGMAPLSNPVELLGVMYQLSLDSDERIRSSALTSAQGLPLNILKGALGGDSDPRVIDFAVAKIGLSDELLEVAVLNGKTADDTIASIAASASQRISDLVAENQIRLLRYPAIIAALYGNTNARMSTVDKVVEIAVRNDVKVSGIPAWEELSRSVLQIAKGEEPKLDAAKMDALFEEAAPPPNSDDDHVPDKPDEAEISLRDMSVPMKIRLAMMGTKFQRSQLIRDPKKIVSMAVIKSPSVKENEAGKYAGNNSICEDVIAYIANKKEWTKLYHIKMSLVANPKCPLPSAMRLLPHLRPKDLQSIARSRNVPSALSAQAKKLAMARGGGANKRR